MTKKIIRYIIVFASVILVGIGASFSVKANVGIGAWDAIAKSIADVISMEIGTMGMILNCSCVLGQLIIYRRKFRWIQLLQIPLSIVLGMVINFFYYHLLTFTIDSYAIRMCMFVCAITVCAFGVAMVMLMDEITFALEGFCNAITSLVPIKFHVVRQLADVFSIVGVFIVTFVFGVPLTVGVGTVVGMIIFGPTLGFFMKVMKPVLKRMNILSYE